MRRQIEVSTEVFARIWALRQTGEESEDAILRRVLSSAQSGGQRLIGFRDARYGVIFPEGFVVSRISQGKERRAEARDGSWWLDGISYGSLNELSRAVTASPENAWKSWYFHDANGERRLIDSLRDRTTVTQRRTKQIGNQRQEMLEDEMETWRDYVSNALEMLGGRAHLDAIYKKVKELCVSTRRRMPPSFEAVIRRTLEENSSDSDAFRTGNDLFCLPEGKGLGVWALRNRGM